MDIFSEELLRVVRTFEKHNIRYIIVGGFATNFHGYARATGDFDFWLEDTFENRKKLVDALEALGYGRFEALMTAPLLPGYCEIMLDNGMYADLMDSIFGFQKEDFPACFEKAVTADIMGVKIRFLHFNHLLHSKESSARLKDKLDAEELRKISRNDESNK